MFRLLKGLTQAALPPWFEPALLIVGAALLFGSGYFKGKWTAEAACEAEALRAQITEMARQAEARESVRARAEAMANAAAAKVAELNKEVDRFEQDLANRPQDARCMLSPDDARRLQHIYNPGEN